MQLLFRHELMHYVPDTYGVDVNDDGGNGCESPDRTNQKREFQRRIAAMTDDGTQMILRISCHDRSPLLKQPQMQKLTRYLAWLRGIRSISW